MIEPLTILERTILTIFTLLSMKAQLNMYNITSPTVPLYLVVFYYGLAGVLSAFGIILLFINLKEKNLNIRIKIFTISSLIFSSVAYILAVVARCVNITDILRRMQLFADILIILSIGLIYKNIQQHQQHQFIRKIILILFYSYIIINIIGIPPDLYDNNFSYFPYKIYLNYSELIISSYTINKIINENEINYFNPILPYIYGDHYIATSFLYHGVMIIEDREALSDFINFTKSIKYHHCYLVFNKIDLDHLFVRVGVSPDYTPIQKIRYYEYNFYLSKIYNNENVFIYTNL